MATSGHVLALTEQMPVQRLAPGDQLFGGEVSHESVAVLVQGRLLIEAGGTQLTQVAVPGAFVGEIASLLGIERTATVTALEPTTVRLIGDPSAFFRDHPEVALELARQLAGRLHRLTSYLTDVRQQYADRDDHLGMVDSLLGRLAARPPVDLEPGSDRAPDY